MIDITTLSWMSFFLIGLGLVLVWFLTVRTRLGKLIIESQTPWNSSQWTRVLVVLLVTCFILVNPLLHLLTFLIIAALYYVLVAQNFLSKNIMDLGSSNDGLNFLNLNAEKIKIVCRPSSEVNVLEQKRALEKCLFSFPLIAGKEPDILYENNEYQVELNLSSKKYASSLTSYIERAGFEVSKVNIK